MAETDGSIVLTVTIDSSQIQSGIQNIVSDINKQVQAEGKNVIAVEKVNQAKAKTQQEQQKVLLNEEKLAQEKEKTRQQEEKTKQAVEQTKQATEKTTTAQNKLKSASSSTLTVVKQLATQLGIIFSVRQIIQFTNESSKLASQTEANVARLSELYGSAAKSVYDFANANANAFGMSKTAAYDAAADYGNIFTTFASGAESAELTQQMLQATAVIASKTGRTYDDVFEKIRSGLYGNTRAIDDLGLSVRQSSLEQTKAYQKISNNGTRSWNSLTDAELQNARALGIIEQATEKYGDTVLESSALVRSRLNAAWEDFKSSWGSIVNVVLVPIMSALTKILNFITSIINKLTGGYDELIGQQDNVESSQNKITDAVDETNESVQDLLASFDELNVVNEDTASTISSSSSSGQPSTDDGSQLKTVETGVSKTLATIMGVVSGALIAIGLILMFTGHIGWGIGFIIAGAATVGATIYQILQGIDPSQILSALEGLMEGIMMSLLAVGVILLFTGHIALAVGFILAGAIIAGVKEIFGDGGDPTTTPKEKLLELAHFIAKCLVCIGVILLFMGHIGWGLGFIILGASAEYMVTEYEKGTFTTFEEAKEKLFDLMDTVGKSLMAVGLILCFLGLPAFGINLMIAGFAILRIKDIAKDADEGNWDGITDKITNFLEGLIVLLVTKELVKNWNKLVTGFSKFGSAIQGMNLTTMGQVVGILGAIVLLCSAFNELNNLVNNWDDMTPSERLISALKILGSVLLACAVAALVFQGSWSFGIGVVAAVGGILLGVSALIGGLSSTSLDTSNLIPEINTDNVDMGNLYKIDANGDSPLPALAKGAVIPANHEFLAILGDQKHGTNIEAPADLIKQMVSEALDERGYTGQQSDTIVTVPVYLGTRQIAEEVIKVSEAKGTQLVKGGFAYAR